MTGTTSHAIHAEDRSIGHFLYALMCAFPLFLVPVLLSLAINLNQKQFTASSVMGRHLRWQRHSIMGLLLLCALGYGVSISWLSMALFALGVLWFSYRVFKGWLSLADGIAV